VRKILAIQKYSALSFRLNALEEFHRTNQEYSVRLLAEAGGVKPATLDHHLRLNKRENSQYVRRREILIPAILDYVRQCKFRPGIDNITHKLNADGYRCSHTIIGAIVKDLRNRCLI